MKQSILLLFAAAWVATSCTEQPRVIEAVVTEGDPRIQYAQLTEGHAIPIESPTQPASDMHRVVIREVLPTSRYVYALVEENGTEYWVATNKTALEIGGTYYFKNGLLKRNFQSKEHDRTFDKLYLVSALISNNHGLSAGATPYEAEVVRQSFTPAPGSVKISEVVANPSKYAGQTIQISGECTKVNPNIMKRHWIHLKDGSKDDYDFVVTSQVQIPVGHAVTFTGTINVARDFGSGYYYEILMEDAVVM